MLLIAPWCKKLINGKENPKNYPWWPELISLIDEPIIQVGVAGELQLVPDFRQNLSIAELTKLLSISRTWISCDSFFQHLAWDVGKPGIVLWSVSDPKIFGHPENTNLLKDRSCLAPNQFLWWEQTEHDKEKFVRPEQVIPHLR
ncbi:Glycosyl transferase, family 9 [uncultured Caudovirales phage]|jgi:ADP-heptose:LPS heptosyltransferase|uniref:Glycosyl transferase, family 9 n=1 Tax=uncultured Caudovirales phage TaxID=2100421 RepID=A0A6J5MX80_9CAUD|nr:Glycosyl transferase, family 9 [uncultured Caudovirales phage]